jgi:ribonuclease BN (tRNA processing enzyme)
MAGTPGTRIVLLGTGTPNADPDRSGPSVALLSGGSCYLVDCGPGLVRRAAAACRTGFTELAPPHLNRAFITHLHSDHTAGLADLLLTPWVLERTDRLELFGPEGISEMSDCIAAAYERDIAGRLNGPEPINTTGYGMIARVVSPGTVFSDENVLVEAFPVSHGAFQAFGYRFRSDDLTIVVSGDTAPVDSIIEASRGCDILIHEVYSAKGLERREPDWMEYYSLFHTSSCELASIATRVRPHLLVLYHQLYCGVSDDELLEEVRSGYDGEVVSGRDLDVY